MKNIIPSSIKRKFINYIIFALKKIEKSDYYVYFYKLTQCLYETLHLTIPINNT